MDVTILAVISLQYMLMTALKPKPYPQNTNTNNFLFKFFNFSWESGTNCSKVNSVIFSKKNSCLHENLEMVMQQIFA